jgi:arylsulfatase A-like enzyme
LAGVILLKKIFNFRGPRAPFVIPLLVCFLAAGGYFWQSRRQLDNPGKNILFIGSDSIRGDYLKYAPHITSFSAEAIQFRNMITPLPRTFPSLTTLLSGTHPVTHKIYHMFPTRSERKLKVKTLPQIAKEKGYGTFVVSDFAGDIFSRSDFGFERKFVPEFNFKMLLEERLLETHTVLLPYILEHAPGIFLFPAILEMANYHDSDGLTAQVKKMIRQSGNNRPFMGFVFYGDAHFPYASPWPYYKKYTKPDYEGPFKYKKDNRADQAEALSRDDVDHIRNMYAGAVECSDHHIGELLDVLRTSGLLSKTIVVVFSDHGENLFEGHRGMGHGDHLSGFESLRTLCLIRNPYERPVKKVVDEYLPQEDILPTVLEMAGLPPPDSIDGKSLVPFLMGKTGISRSVFCETGIWFSENTGDAFQTKRYGYPDISSTCFLDTLNGSDVVLKDFYRPLILSAKYRCMIENNYKLIYSPVPGKALWELYDLKSDPQEKFPIGLKDNPQGTAMKESLLKFYSRNSEYKIYENRVIYDPLLAY